jgi:hypothetical protein
MIGEKRMISNTTKKTRVGSVTGKKPGDVQHELFCILLAKIAKRKRCNFQPSAFFFFIL